MPDVLHPAGCEGHPFPSDKLIDWDSVVEKLQSLAQAWPANKIYTPAKLALLKIGRKCGVKIEVTKNIEVRIIIIYCLHTQIQCSWCS